MENDSFAKCGSFIKKNRWKVVQNSIDSLFIFSQIISLDWYWNFQTCKIAIWGKKNFLVYNKVYWMVRYFPTHSTLNLKFDNLLKFITNWWSWTFSTEISFENGKNTGFPRF